MKVMSRLIIWKFLMNIINKERKRMTRILIKINTPMTINNQKVFLKIISPAK